MKKYILKTFGVLAALVLISCGSDDSSDTNSGNAGGDCPKQPTNQVASGIFKGESFTSTGGTYSERTFGETKRFFCRIYITEPTSGSCNFPTFESSGSILFEISSLEPQTIQVSDEISDTIMPTLSFNSMEEDTSVSDLACGAIIIEGVDVASDQLKGSVIGETALGNSINGNFVLELCNIF